MLGLLSTSVFEVGRNMLAGASALVATIAGATRWFARRSLTVLDYVTHARLLFDAVLIGGVVTREVIRRDGWRERNIAFELAIPEVRDRGLRRRCRTLLALVREVCDSAAPRLRTLRAGVHRTIARQMCAARDGLEACRAVHRRVMRNNRLTYGIVA